MKSSLLYILFILNIIYSCKGPDKETICNNNFDLNSIIFENKNSDVINKIFKLEAGFYGIRFEKNKEWSINKNDIRGYIYKKKDTATCISFFNEKILANKDYAIYLDLEKKIYAYSLQANKVENIEGNIGKYIAFNKKYFSKNLNEYESKKLFQNFSRDEKILKFDFPDKIVMINYVNNRNYPNNLIIRAITKKPLTQESYNIIKQEYEIYIQ